MTVYTDWLHEQRRHSKPKHMLLELRFCDNHARELIERCKAIGALHINKHTCYYDPDDFCCESGCTNRPNNFIQLEFLGAKPNPAPCIEEKLW